MPRSSFWLLPLAALAFPAMAAPKKAEPADPNKVRCKSQIETGSLVKRNKICHTEAEWQRISETGRRDTQTLQTSAVGQTN